VKPRRTLIDSFRDAFIGVGTALREERNMRIHFFVAAAVLTAAVMLGVERLELVILVLMICIVISLELVNSAIERAVDLAEPNINPLAALAKRLAASAVLIVAVAAVAIGLLIFWPYVF